MSIVIDDPPEIEGMRALLETENAAEIQSRYFNARLARDISKVSITNFGPQRYS